MKAHYRNRMENFIISRAFVLLLISIILFPLLIFTTTAKKNHFEPCIAQSLFSHGAKSNLAPDSKAAKSTPSPQIPLDRPSRMQTLAISFLAWWTCPPRIPLFEQKRKKKGTLPVPSIFEHFDLEQAVTYLNKTALQTLCRTLLFIILWLLREQWLPWWVVCLPVAEWLANAIWRTWPALACQPEVSILSAFLSNARLITFWLLLVTIVTHWLDFLITGSLMEGHHDLGVINPLAGLVLSKPSPNLANSGQISIAKLGPDQQEAFQINLSGEFYLTVDPANKFWTRMVIIFLRQLQSDSLPSAGRPTRDGRRPIVSQTRLAEAFSVTQPEISRWEKYWLEQDWPNLLRGG